MTTYGILLHNLWTQQTSPSIKIATIPGSSFFKRTACAQLSRSLHEYDIRSRLLPSLQDSYQRSFWAVHLKKTNLYVLQEHENSQTIILPQTNKFPSKKYFLLVISISAPIRRLF